MRFVLYLVAAACLLGLCTGALHPLALPLFVLTVAAHLAFIASLGIWVSLTARSIAWSHFVMAVLLLLFFGGGWLIRLYATPIPADSGWAEELLRAGLTPWGAWWVATIPLFGFHPVAEAPAMAGVLLVPPGLYLGAAAALWVLAIHRFVRERGDAPDGPDHAPVASAPRAP